MFDLNNNQNGAYNFNGYTPQQAPKINNFLTAEEIKTLQSQRQDFTLALTQKETLQAKCNHRSADGATDTLRIDPVTGKAVCAICGYEFRPIDAETSIDSIKDASDRIVDILQTIKILYTDMPGEAAANYFQIIPLIEKIPQLFEFAAKSFGKHEYNAWSYNNYNMGGMAMLQGLQSTFAGGFQPQGFGMAPQQPMGFPTPAPQMPGANPFGYPGASQQPMAPMGGYQPYAFQPQAAPAAPTPAPAAAPAADTTVTQTVSV